MSDSADFIEDPRFHRVFEFPADPENGRPGVFRVTYADFGYRNESDPDQENVLLFFGPLMGSRLAHIPKDDLAKRHKIRVINADRPGTGQTERVGPSERMSLWLR
jgi:hypothetical protein